MSIEYLVGLDCSVKQSLTAEGMVAKVKGRDQASAIVEMLRQRGDERDPAEITFQRMLQTPEGPVAESCRVRDLLDEAEELEQYESVCTGCLVNILDRPFGCYGSIKYPFPAEAEEWLMSLLPDELDTPAGVLLLQAIKDFKYTGAHAASMRKQSPTFFASKSPVKRKWGSFLRGQTIDSNQLLQAMFFVGHIKPSHSVLLCHFLGILPHTLPPERTVEIMSTPALMLNIVDMETLKPPPPEGIDVACFVMALARAATLNLQILIDV